MYHATKVLRATPPLCSKAQHALLHVTSLHVHSIRFLRNIEQVKIKLRTALAPFGAAAVHSVCLVWCCGRQVSGFLVVQSEYLQQTLRNLTG